MPSAHIITIGDELLIGQIINNNSVFISQELNKIGINIYQVSTVSDNIEHIINSIRLAENNSDIIIITGGLGPTSDDYTKDALCRYFNSSLKLNEQALEDIRDLFAKRAYSLTEHNRQQAMVPDHCSIIRNFQGTAPGLWFEQKDKIYIALPGVPFEMKAMISEYIIPKLKTRFSSQNIIHKTILTQGVGESFLADTIKDWELSLPKHIKLAYLPSPGIVRLRLSTSGEDYNLLLQEIENYISGLKNYIGDLIFGYDEDTLENVTGKLLADKKLSLSVAESCTGGLIAHKITSVPGASDYFKGSVVAYSNNVKTNLLKVSEEILKTNGAVSEPVVMQMAEGCRTLFNTDYAIATTGVAGPGGGSKNKPVGTTWIAISSSKETKAYKFFFGDNRERNIQRAMLTALNLLRKDLIKF
ncbi:MAG: competence/damage-inducible protein A [Bacteroidales bacterium]|nr:competence/damage-inducible protein A [Bacteroidales bacterium]